MWRAGQILKWNTGAEKGEGPNNWSSSTIYYRFCWSLPQQWLQSRRWNLMPHHRGRHFILQWLQSRRTISVGTAPLFAASISIARPVAVISLTCSISTWPISLSSLPLCPLFLIHLHQPSQRLWNCNCVLQLVKGFKHWWSFGNRYWHLFINWHFEWSDQSKERPSKIHKTKFSVSTLYTYTYCMYRHKIVCRSPV